MLWLETMGVACIIENENLVADQIKSSLLEIDANLDILVFKNLDGFYQWFSQMISLADSEKSKKELKLLIGDIQFLGPNYFSIIERARKLMKRRGILKQEDDLAIILTSFESHSLNFKEIETRIITNLIFKPFDLPILKQHLQIALSNQKVITNYIVFTQKLKTNAEMLKEVQLESFTELGFTTRSNRELKINEVSKYYNRHFEANGKLNLLARCISCKPHPQNSGEYLADFRFVGLSNLQVKKLRQSLFTMEHTTNNEHAFGKQFIPKAIKKTIISDQGINFLVFLKAAIDPSLELRDVIEQNLYNVSVTYNRNMALFTEAITKNDFTVIGEKPIHAIFLNADYFNPSHGVASWTHIQEQIESLNRRFKVANPKPKIILTSSHEITDEKLRPWSGLVSDIIFTPVDRPYLTKRLLTLFPEIQPRQENIEIMSTQTNEVIRVANPIELTSISETCLTMKYYRPISFHSFRRFCLPSPNFEEVVELLASCYFNEKIGEDTYINHFVFFGITDKYLKYIRKWILERHIASKKS